MNPNCNYHDTTTYPYPAAYCLIPILSQTISTALHLVTFSTRFQIVLLILIYMFHCVGLQLHWNYKVPKQAYTMAMAINYTKINYFINCMYYTKQFIKILNYNIYSIIKHFIGIGLLILNTLLVLALLAACFVLVGSAWWFYRLSYYWSRSSSQRRFLSTIVGIITI